MHTPNRNKALSQATQGGFVLIVALILLLVLTLLGLAAAQSTSLEERMAGNMRDQNLAFQAAEAGLRAAETCLSGGGALCANFTANTNGNFIFTPSAPPPPSTASTPLW
ncbi:MAG: pilus assembly PilX family protein, partial [Gammaproteobacteria bacterium]